MGKNSTAPSTPNYARKARDIVRSTREQQKKIADYFEKRADKYIGLKEATDSKIDRMFGTTGADYVAAINKSYYGNMEDVSDKYKNMLTQEPSLLNTQAFGDFSNVLRQGSQEYGQAVTSASRIAGDRLYGTLGAPAAIAENLASSPSANNLIDQTFMDYAKRPPTVGNVMDEMSPYYTFNADMTPYDIASFNVKKYKADTTPYDVKSYRIPSINV